MATREFSSDPLEHDPEKARPALDAGCEAVFRKNHAQSKTQSAMTNRALGISVPDRPKAEASGSKGAYT
jgi:hypothetical protein